MFEQKKFFSWVQAHHPEFRIRAFFFLAVMCHIIGLVSFHAAPPPLKSNQDVLDLVLLPPPLPQTEDNGAFSQSKAQQVKNTNENKEIKLSQAQRTKSIASQHQKVLAPKLLRKRTVSSSYYEPQDKDYLSRWQAYIEQMGNEHYPNKANQLKLKGSLRLMVSVNKDGSLNNVSLRRSSGHDVLDNAAIQIVQLSAPFEPLPPEIAQDLDVLEIVRTWQFNGTFSSKS